MLWLKLYCYIILSFKQVGCKIDLVRADGAQQRQVPFEEAKHFARDQGIQFIETSARNGLNVERAFEIIAQEVSVAFSRHIFLYI